ncbi:MAG: TolC family protein [Bacteroidetes bacterium]|nr:TolC family protein [Bacteroidota bacterium]
MTKFKFILLFLWVHHSSFAQDSLLHAEQVLKIVKEFHPVVRLASLDLKKSAAEVLAARGAFDPVISNYISTKNFAGENYYSFANPHLSIPTWYGIELFAGVENLSGNRFEVSETIGKTSYAGISASLLKNLVIDKRRAILQQAKLFNSMAMLEQKIVINNILLDAMDAYWRWVYAYQNYLIMNNNVEVTNTRFELVKKAYKNGERPAIDTLEALAQLQSFQYQQNDARLAFQNAGLALSLYLWKSNNEPYVLPQNVIPQKGWEQEEMIRTNNFNLQDLLNLALDMHPELNIYDQKMDILRIDKKLKFQELLPKLDVQYNILNKGYYVLNDASALLDKNYQYGIKMEMPLRFSQGRGLYKQAIFKIEQTEISRTQKRQQIEIKVKSYYNELLNYKNQIELQRDNYENYRKLVTAEEAKLMNGESSLFLVNSRENKALEAYLKLIELKTKYFKTIYALQWSTGVIAVN